MKRIAVLSLSLCLLSSLTWADELSQARLANWHQWRGPDATGMSPAGDPPIEWDQQKNVKWKVAIPGKGTSTPIVWADKVFVLTVVDTGKAGDPEKLPKQEPAGRRGGFGGRAPTTIHQFIVMCLDRKDGNILWKQVATEQVPHEAHQRDNSYASASPTTDGKHLYVSFGSRGVYCFDLDGKLQWQRDLGDMRTRNGFGEGISPVIHGDTLIVNWDNEDKSFIVALDAKTGKTKWQTDREEKTSWSTPVVVEHQGKAQVVVNATSKVRSYDFATGQLIWQCGGQGPNAIPSPVANSEMVYCMTGFQRYAAHAIPLNSTGDLTGSDKLAWKHDKGTPYVPSPLLIGDRLYFTQSNNAVLSCLDAATGKPIISQERLQGLGGLYASPVGTKDRIYIVDRRGTTLVLKRGDKVEVLATNKLDEPIDASPAIVGKQLFLRGEKHIYCIESGAGVVGSR